MYIGEQIIEVITNTLLELDIKSARVVASDNGALYCVIKARVQTAAYRAAGSVDYKW
ncbi:hypothetical protein [Clostridium magnum]|uniref:Citrate lyase acyl carrier protein n=1 Tax=Clostridium magnum DSM 2767 TaxID=1121326 RepID=A0A162QUU7_9CLOT|nr:hypothetical protein [Clostridium magnum]KZL88997.1 citrate lyase acyl carrier protein [Clostridium magnum DSM 2767]SHI23411.1 citrate lyase acyl carrier protein [Clostridium magnum DSM 2767]